VYGALLSPKGGIPGAGNQRVSDNMISFGGGLEIVTNHGIAHDAAGYLKTHHDRGPGYQYVPGTIDLLSNTNPLAGQTTGLRLFRNRTWYGQATEPLRDN